MVGEGLGNTGQLAKVARRCEFFLGLDAVGVRVPFPQCCVCFGVLSNSCAFMWEFGTGSLFAVRIELLLPCIPVGRPTDINGIPGGYAEGLPICYFSSHSWDASRCHAAGIIKGSDP